MISLEKKSSAKVLLIKSALIILLVFGLSACGEEEFDGYEPVPGPSYSTDENCKVWSEKASEVRMIRIGIAGSCSSISIEDYEFFLNSVLEEEWAEWPHVKVLYVNSQEGSEDLEREVYRLAEHQDWMPCIRENTVDQCFTEIARKTKFFSSITGIVAALVKKNPEVRFEGVACRGGRMESRAPVTGPACRPISFGVAVFKLD